MRITFRNVVTTILVLPILPALFFCIGCAVTVLGRPVLVTKSPDYIEVIGVGSVFLVCLLSLLAVVIGFINIWDKNPSFTLKNPFKPKSPYPEAKLLKDTK